MNSFQKPIADWAKAILFDFDFTLGDSSQAVVECVNLALEKVGAAKATPQAIKHTIGLPLDIIFGRFAPEHVEPAKRYFHLYAGAIMVDKTVLMSGLVDLIRLISRNTELKLAVISTKNKNRIHQILAKFNLENHFHAIVGGDDVANPKPAPDATLLALQKLDCSAGEAIFVGDSVMDAGSAKAAAVVFVGVTSGTTSEAQLREAGASAVYSDVVTALQDLLQIEKGQPGRKQHYVNTSPEDLQNEVEITYFKSSGPGGQKKNKTSSAVRIKHVPTGIIVVATENRSQHKNREMAWQRLIDRLEKLNEKPKPRLRTKPPATVKEARLKEKKATSLKKQFRKPPSFED
jgi:phosphoglycolate phosphatase